MFNLNCTKVTVQTNILQIKKHSVKVNKFRIIHNKTQTAGSLALDEAKVHKIQEPHLALALKSLYYMTL